MVVVLSVNAIVPLERLEHSAASALPPRQPRVDGYSFACRQALLVEGDVHERAGAQLARFARRATSMLLSPRSRATKTNAGAYEQIIGGRRRDVRLKVTLPGEESNLAMCGPSMTSRPGW